ncbi:hypothetical protein GQ53DRAFT_823209 [Thozetella sp. PMI_491]|nr:hypothetical protein GQ53DRAFT_823209 [Thozetella sp. PMI_491]
MVFFRFASALALLGLTESRSAPRQTGGGNSGNYTLIPTNNATAFAITYGYPLIQYAASLGPVIDSLGPNAIFHENSTATATGAAIVRPNVDTVYSKVAVDLSSADVVLTIPPVPDGRFYVIPFYDLWGNNFANIGSLTNILPGQYLIQRAKNSSSVGFETATNESEYQGYISFPTTYGLVLPRILLFNQSGDIEVVREIQSRIKVTEIPQSGCREMPALSNALLESEALAPMNLTYPMGLDQSSIETLLEVVARVASYNPPIQAEYLPAVVQNFKAAGLSNGHYTPPSDVNYASANTLVLNGVLSLLGSGLESFGNGWVDLLPQYSGNFHDGYAARSWIAFTGYLQLVQDVVIYPQYNGTMSLAANESYIFTFPSGKPPVQGFWSLTAYNSESYLIPNPINVYSLGDRSNITYPDGTRVYEDNSRNDPFSILIQPADLSPSANWTSNWLPAPAGGGSFTVNLRFYAPTEPLVVGGSYVYPIVTKQGAILA